MGEMMIVAHEGTRVEVYSPDRSKYLGRGTIIKMEPLYFESGEKICDDYPTIELDTGELIEGLHCWWRSLKGGL